MLERGIEQRVRERDKKGLLERKRGRVCKRERKMKDHCVGEKEEACVGDKDAYSVGEKGMKRA